MGLGIGIGIGIGMRPGFAPSGGVGPAAKLLFIDQPTNVVAGASISPSVTVGVYDASNNLITTDNTTSVVMTGPSGGTLTRTASSGIATFNNLTYATSGSKTMSAAASGLTGATSSSFTVSAGAAAKILYIVQPVKTAQDAVITPAFTIGCYDSLNNLRTSDNATSIVISGPSGGTLTRTCSSGVATFNNITYDTAGSKTISATSSGLTGATSSAFIITGEVSVNVASGGSFNPNAASTSFKVYLYGKAGVGQDGSATGGIGGGGGACNGAQVLAASYNGPYAFSDEGDYCLFLDNGSGAIAAAYYGAAGDDGGAGGPVSGIGLLFDYVGGNGFDPGVLTTGGGGGGGASEDGDGSDATSRIGGDGAALGTKGGNGGLAAGAGADGTGNSGGGGGGSGSSAGGIAAGYPFAKCITIYT